MVLKRTDFEPVSTFRGCGSLERTNFEQFVLSEGVVLVVWWCGGLERT